jgi:hypothetical protein
MEVELKLSLSLKFWIVAAGFETEIRTFNLRITSQLLYHRATTLACIINML